MDITSGLRSEAFKTITNTIVPGSLATGPYLLIAGHYFSQVALFFNDHPYAFVGIVVVLVLSVGVILEDIGTFVEAEVWDRVILKKDTSHLENWRSYLQLRLGSDLIAQRYVRKIVAKLKFELSMIPALLVFLFGMIWFDRLEQVFTFAGLTIFIIVTLVLTFYMIWESHDSAVVLSRTRKLILEVTQPVLLPKSPRKKVRSSDPGKRVADGKIANILVDAQVKPNP